MFERKKEKEGTIDDRVTCHALPRKSTTNLHVYYGVSKEGFLLKFVSNHVKTSMEGELSKQAIMSIKQCLCNYHLLNWCLEQKKQKNNNIMLFINQSI